MIERHSGQMQIVCECGNAQRRIYEADEFDIMVSDARAEGFVIAKVAGEWQHTCQDCATPGRKQRSML